MHYTGTIWRPPYEASSLLLEVTAGCTHHSCKFCTLYADLPFKFKMSPLADIEADLKEAKAQMKLWKNSRVSRTFLTGANPFVLKFSRLMEIADLIKKYFPGNKTIGCFSRVTDISKHWNLCTKGIFQRILSPNVQDLIKRVSAITFFILRVFPAWEKANREQRQPPGYVTSSTLKS